MWYKLILILLPLCGYRNLITQKLNQTKHNKTILNVYNIWLTREFEQIELQFI